MTRRRSRGERRAWWAVMSVWRGGREIKPWWAAVTAGPGSPPRPGAPGRSVLRSTTQVVRTIAAAVLASGLPPGVALNVNIPPQPVRGVKITRLGWKFYDPEIIEKTDPRNSSYFRIGTGVPRRVGEPGTDVIAAHQGFVSLTPLHTDMTAHHALRSPLLRRLVKALAPG